MGEMAQALEVTPGTATTMIKALFEAGLVEYEPRLGTRLTDRGVILALHVLRRHRLVELFLVQTLGMGWAEIHEEAEQLEHVMSDRLIERIDKKLGHPTVDPHGDPIPSAQGKVNVRPLLSLCDAPIGKFVVIGRIADQGESFLQFAERNSMVPGRIVRLKTRDDTSGVISVEVEGEKTVALGITVATKIEVEPFPS